ncbi:hypothetical protein Oweho_0049 [Owenweeksia hongkongensis DSM 17368]|uniref:Oxygen tolerance n=1 Tax=Owenweeksia hongkongensis (strain DSM 17368 / CIP 108786 / JCM 12287 / NRRL B-23963 / UST20020801) TaxID=926562 RepID=G8R562_OWEHD|nr:BatD family protein [Owenweeksia hongkongensis]AEV31073.1 hypothetical protein Oweho_0049 [Owenweeksia hongkongensis DSM 17368]
MRSLGKIVFLTWVLGVLLVFLSHSAQAQKLWSEVSLNKQSVYLGEPVEVTVSVYTSTWFTAGVDPGNVKVKDAYTVFFRNVSTSKTVAGKTVSGVQMIFNVFPNSAKNITFPELEIEVETPKEGGYKGIAHVVKTKPHQIKVRPIPPGFEAEQWLVTTSLSVSQQWDADIKNVKVGDVLTRTISRNAANTVSQLLPPVIWDSVAGISEYPYRSNVESHRSKTAISAKRTETMRYLFEKEGEVILPEMEFTWWNPYHKKLYKRTLKEVKIDVQPNPDLGMLASVRDSLQAQIAKTEAAEEQAEAPFTILGMSVKKFVTVLASIILLLVALMLMLKWALNYRRNYLLKYHSSELYYFRKLKKAIRRNNNKEQVKNLYIWIDRLHLKEPTLTYFAEVYGTENFYNQAQLFESRIAEGDLTYKLDVKELSKGRKKFVESGRYTIITNGWINP